jgi:acetyltransferase-like isoleucine patch superfamily enzyme
MSTNGNNFLDLTGNIILEKGVSLGPGVTIMTHNRYNHNRFLEERMAHTCGIKDVLIKEGAGIKAGALITHGITIGKNAVVGGGAVVNRDVPDNCFVAGVPARMVKEIK